MPRIVLAGSLDTKGREYAFLAAELRRAGLTPVLVDVGVGGAAAAREPGATGAVDLVADVTREMVAEAAGMTLDQVRGLGDRSAILEAMARGLCNVLAAMQGAHGAHGVDDATGAEGLAGADRLAGVEGLAGAVGMGGSGAVTLLAPAWRSLPPGMPKLLLTTMTSTAAQAFEGTDVQVLPSLVDVSGLNPYTRGLLSRVAATVAAQAGVPVPEASSTPMVAATMFGVTTKGVTAASAALERAGFDVLTFHANGAGGRAMESMAGQGVFRGVLDLTTTELADELLGGKATAGPDRLEAAGLAGVPQVVSIGALDVANFGSPGTIPQAVGARRTYRHGPLDTLVRTSAEDCRALGALLARKLARARGSVTVVLPSGGSSSLAEAGRPFWDEGAESALVEALVRGLPDHVRVVRVGAPLDSEEFGRRAAAELLKLMNA